MRVPPSPAPSPASLRPQDLAGALPQALFLPLGADGVYARTALYETVLEAVSAVVTRHRPPAAEVLRLPPVMSRREVERSGYLRNFPQLLACACCLHGPEAELGRVVDRSAAGAEDWTGSLAATDLVLTPAACYPLYPLAAARGALPPEGLTFDVGCECFRREPSRSLDRLQSFRMREYVRIGAPEAVVAFRQDWIERGRGIAEDLALPCRVSPAHDPFFGRASAFRAASQIHHALKFELLVVTVSPERPTACMSFNYHRDHFGTTWDIRGHDGALAHTGCIGFGLDRLALALFCTHGLEVACWPARVRAVLEL